MLSPRLPHSLHTALLYSLAFGAIAPAAAWAQGASAAPAPAYLAVVDGQATLDRGGQTQPAEMNAPLVPGDRLRTSAGRLEVVFPDEAVLDVDANSIVDLQSPTRLRLMQGRARLVVPGTGPQSGVTPYQIDTSAGSARIDGPGDFRLAVVADASGSATQLATLRGSASLQTERGTTVVGAGEQSVAQSGETTAILSSFNSAEDDAFDRWSASEQDARTTSAASDQYLPTDLQIYGETLDQNGSWAYDEPYGYVWYPRVTGTWRPYLHGRWSAMRSYGWTWIGAERWSWPTDHYGRWGFARNAWFWVPGSRWGPAWVSWAAAPGYVSWCPLGVDSRPLFTLGFGAASFAPGWVIVPRSVFGDTGYRVDRYALTTRHFDRDTPFIQQSVPPVAAPRVVAVRAVAMPGAGAGATVPRALPREGTSARATAVAAPARTIAPPRYPPTIRVERQPAPALPAPGAFGEPASAEPTAEVPPTAGFRMPLAGPRRAPEVVAPRWTTRSGPAAPRWAPAVVPPAGPRPSAPAAREPNPRARENVVPPSRGGAVGATRDARPTPPRGRRGGK